MKRLLLGFALFAIAIFGLERGLLAAPLSFTGDLRFANVTGCGSGCTLDPATDSDADFAQWAAQVETFTLAAPTAGYAITFGYGGGTNGAGQIIAPGGFEPYLSLFDGAGNFLASTYFGEVCPPGAGTYHTACYDVKLDFGTLAAGTYQIAISAFSNMSLAENLGSGTLSDGFTGLGNLAVGEDLHYAFDVVFDGGTVPVPEPGALGLVGTGLLGLIAVRRWRVL